MENTQRGLDCKACNCTLGIIIWGVICYEISFFNVYGCALTIIPGRHERTLEMLRYYAPSQPVFYIWLFRNLGILLGSLNNRIPITHPEGNLSGALCGVVNRSFSFEICDATHRHFHSSGGSIHYCRSYFCPCTKPAIYQACQAKYDLMGVLLLQKFIILYYFNRPHFIPGVSIRSLVGLSSPRSRSDCSRLERQTLPRNMCSTCPRRPDCALIRLS